MTCARLSVKVAQGCEKPWSSPHAAPPRATQCLNSFPKGSRGAHRTSAVPVLPLVAIPHKRTIDPRQPTLPGSGKAGKGALPSTVGCPTTTRAGSSGKWRRKRKLLCEARKSEHARRVSECSDWAWPCSLVRTFKKVRSGQETRVLCEKPLQKIGFGALYCL